MMGEKTPQPELADNGDLCYSEYANSIKEPLPSTLTQLIREYLLYNCYVESVDCLLDSSVNTSRNNPVAVDANIDGNASEMDVDGDSTNNKQGAKQEDVEMVDSSVNGNPRTTQDTPLHETLKDRKVIRDAILSGQINAALETLQSAFTNVLRQDSELALDILFDLKCQQFIELSKTDTNTAMTYAQEELGAFTIQSPKYLQMLQDVVAIIAYEDPNADGVPDSVKGYLTQERREYVASRVNSFILSSMGQPPRPMLETIVRQTIAVRDTLYEETSKDKKAKKIFQPLNLSHFVSFVKK